MDAVLAVVVGVTVFGTFWGSLPSTPWFLAVASGTLVIITVIGNKIGCTPGMWLSGLALASTDGSKFTWRRAILRTILIGFPRKKAMSRMTVVLAPRGTQKPLALRLIVQLAWVQMILAALIIGLVIHGVGPRPPPGKNDFPSGFIEGATEEAQRVLVNSPGVYDDYTAGRATGLVMFAGLLSVLILLMVRLRAPTAITVLSAIGTLVACQVFFRNGTFGMMSPPHIAILLLSLHGSVRAYRRGPSSSMKVFLQYKQRAQRPETLQTSISSGGDQKLELGGKSSELQRGG